ncbi:hypothetical protein TH63_05740 [Rufibacter radiotolerans]|uniref:DUF6565 domain-containing protein n=1 Tax=Rufibacter radiotolerans TaxID=1379910 RepID=A0A0H4W4A6_9BACT|nr:DUF6565 domain-containing protein [Rufibacter radiotolerans]AKQ45251.1 hypothetical protein TH63_05740 [Rufibacter radiotolerans]
MKMPNLFQKSTLLAAATVSLAFTQVACNKTEKTDTTTSTTTTTTTTKDQAYDDYKNYVTTLESDVERGWDTTITDADQRMTQWKNDYETRRSAVAQYEGDFDENRRREYDSLQTRYSTAWAAREQQYNTWRQTHQGAGSVSKVDMSVYNESKIPSYTATNIRTAYEDFVKHVEANKANFSNDDWKIVDKYWSQLDDRKNAIQSQLSDKDKWEIAKAKTKYTTMKAGNKTGNTASNVGSDVKEVGKDVSNSKVGEATKDAGKAVGNTAKKAGQKVGEVFKDDKKDN